MGLTKQHCHGENYELFLDIALCIVPLEEFTRFLQGPEQHFLTLAFDRA